MQFPLLFKIMFYSCAAFHLVKSNSFPNTTDDIPDLPLCSRTCKGNATGSDEEFGVYRCSCSPSCQVYGDCCYDSDYKNSSVNLDYICVHVVGRGPIQAISSCPSGQQSEFCMSALSHLPPVTSKVTNITYANVFCAQCNGDVMDYVTWNVELRCCPEPEKVNNSQTSNNGRLFLRQHYIFVVDKNGLECPCTYHVHYGNFDAIDSLELRSCSRQRKISQCSYNWSDLDTEAQCWSYEDPVYIGSHVFRNQHCAICNSRRLDDIKCMPPSVRVLMQFGYNETSIMDLCNNERIQSCIQYYRGLGRGQAFALSDMMRPISNTRVCVPDPGERCCAGERYDFRSKRCRKTRRL